MAGALSLQEDIIALVEKHSDTCLPEYLLRRLAEEARLLAAREEIRSLHEEDRFGLFSEPNIAENDRVGEETEDLKEPGEGKDENIAVLPDYVKRMLATMKIVRLDKVVALSGFTTIDAEVEFKHQSSATGERGEKEAGRSEMAPENRPVFLTFRFRREPLTKSGPEEDFDGNKNDAAAMAPAESVDLEDEGEDYDDAGDIMVSKVQAALMKVQNGHRVNVNNENNGAARFGSEGRKRTVSRGTEFDGRGGSKKGRKRSKGGRDQEEGEGDEDEDRENNGGDSDDPDSVFGDLDRDDDSESDQGLDYEPKTLVSYTICGGLGYDRPEVLLQAVVYARGDGPACVMPPPEDEEDPESIFRDQEDVFDCNVDGPALAAVGEALGLHHDPTALESSGGSSGEKGLDLKEASGPEGGGMTLSDLVWWIMLFPFFEEEFDMVEVVASSVFGDEGSDSDDGECDSQERDDDGGEDVYSGREKA